VKNGPYIVTGSVPLSEQTIVCDQTGAAIAWQNGREYPLKETYALCRCGKSTNMPFCDGAHARAGFDGTETADRKPYLEAARRIEGPGMDLTDAPDLCASARFCRRGRGVWKLTLASDLPESRALAIEEARLCPSGRLVAWSKDGTALEPELPPSIALVIGPRPGIPGPIWVRGAIEIESADGTVYEARNRVTLCRCGRSANKPYCDGNHESA